MITKGDKLVRYELDESFKILYEDVTIMWISDDGDKARVRNEDGKEFFITLDLVDDSLQANKDFYMSKEVFMKAYMVFEKYMQFEKVCAEDELRMAIENQNKFYKVNNSEKDSVIRSTREEREQTRSSEPIIPIFMKK